MNIEKVLNNQNPIKYIICVVCIETQGLVFQVVFNDGYKMVILRLEAALISITVLIDLDI
jgi:hypothetical protein